MDRRTFLAACTVSCAAPGWAAAQAPKAWRIGYLSVASVDLDRSWIVSFREGLRDLGYVEGRNLFIEQRHAHGNARLLPELASDLVLNKVDVLVVYGAWLMPLPKNVPVVFTVAADPLAAGLVSNLARPGGNVTGFSDAHAELVPKRLELLRAVAPKASRIAVFMYPNVSSRNQLGAAQAAAAKLGMTLIPVEVKSAEADEFDRAVEALGKDPAHGLLVIAEPIISAHRARIVTFAVRQRIPGIGTQRRWSDEGLLLSYGTNFNDLWRRVAGHVDKILKGAMPGDLAVEQPTKFELGINRRTANAIGLALPSELLLRADHITE